MSIAVRLRSLNVFYFSLFALFISFLPVYASKIGISGTNIGLILGLGSVVCIVSQPVWGIISDKFRTIKEFCFCFSFYPRSSGRFCSRATSCGFSRPLSC